MFTWIRLALPCMIPRGHCWDSEECIHTSKHLVNAKWSFHHHASRPDETKPLAGLCWQVCGPGGSVSQAPDLQEGAESQTSYGALL